MQDLHFMVSVKSQVTNLSVKSQRNCSYRKKPQRCTYIVPFYNSCLENYAVEVAQFFHRKQDFQRSSEYYMMSVEARNKIKKGEIINETQSGHIGSSGVN